MAREDFLKYVASYSGIDGGDIDAEYWFMGMEWSDISDVGEGYNWLYNCWQEITEISDHVDIKMKPEGWKLERSMDILYHMLMPEDAVGKTIFEKDSNSFKLNLLPLPINNSEIKEKWNQEKKDEYSKHLLEATGFSSFEDYYKESLKLRRKIFQELLMKNNKPKTVFCFGKNYQDGFLEVLTDDKNNHCENLEIKLPDSKSGGKNLKVAVYNVDSRNINRIIVSPFPYFRRTWNFTINDWVTIRTVATEDWEQIRNLAKE